MLRFRLQKTFTANMANVLAMVSLLTMLMAVCPYAPARQLLRRCRVQKNKSNTKPVKSLKHRRMSNTITLNMGVVKKYHTLINNKAGYASVACVGFLPLIEIFFRAFERKFRQMVERLPNQPFRIVKAKPCRLCEVTEPKKLRLFGPITARTLSGRDIRFSVLDVREDFAEGRPSAKDRKIVYHLWGFVQGGYLSLCLLAPLEKRNINY